MGHLDNSHPTAISFLIVALFPHFSSRVAAAVMSRRLNYTTLLCYTLPLAIGQAGFNSFSRQTTRSAYSLWIHSKALLFSQRLWRWIKNWMWSTKVYGLHKGLFKERRRFGTTGAISHYITWRFRIFSHDAIFLWTFFSTIVNLADFTTYTFRNKRVRETKQSYHWHDWTYKKKK